VLAARDYAHPIFDRAALAAQRELPDLQGIGGVYFAGAWAGFGFHEDGFVSGQRAAAALLRDLRKHRAA
jgi:predicted NAD/FAD-binding protein